MDSSASISVQKWQIVGWAAIAISLMVGGVWLVNGLTETGMRIAIRWTARSSCLLFLLAFTGSTLAALWPGLWTQWLRKNRRYLGLSFAVSHGWHAIAIAGLAWISSGKAVGYSPGAILGYVFIGLMTLTSSDRAVQWLGVRHWQILHSVGAYYLWLAFFVSFSKKWSVALIYPAMTGLLAIAIGLRAHTWIQRKINV